MMSSLTGNVSHIQDTSHCAVDRINLLGSFECMANGRRRRTRDSDMKINLGMCFEPDRSSVIMVLSSVLPLPASGPALLPWRCAPPSAGTRLVGTRLVMPCMYRAWYCTEIKRLFCMPKESKCVLDYSVSV